MHALSTPQACPAGTLALSAVRALGGLPFAAEVLRRCGSCGIRLFRCFRFMRPGYSDRAAGGHLTSTTELVYRHQIVSAMTRGAEVMDQIFG
jgi:hypothetical protein